MENGSLHEKNGENKEKATKPQPITQILDATQQRRRNATCLARTQPAVVARAPTSVKSLRAVRRCSLRASCRTEDASPAGSSLVDFDGRVDFADEEEAGEPADGARQHEERERHQQHVAEKQHALQQSTTQ